MPDNQYLPQGQTPLTLDPLTWGQGQWQGSGGGDVAAQFYAAQEFNKLFGRNPSQSELDQFATYYKGADPNIANVSGGNQAVSSYFNQQQQLANAPQQEAQQIQQQIPIIQDLINQQMTGTIKNLTDPTSPQYQQFAGNLNNLGITPSSGAFQSGLGGAIGNAANQYLSQALGAVGLPIAQTYAQGSTTPFTNAMSQPQQLFGNNLQLQDFLQQMTAGQNIANANSPSDLEKWGIPLGQAAIQGAGQAGAAQLGKAPTWICTAMVEVGAMTRLEVKTLHDHLFKAFWNKPLKFIGYFLFGRLLVLLANKVNVSWKVWKPSFYDAVIAEPNPSKAVDLYEEAFWNLFSVVRRRIPQWRLVPR